MSYMNSEAELLAEEIWLDVCTYMYIHTYIHTYTHICIYGEHCTDPGIYGVAAYVYRYIHKHTEIRVT